MSCLKSIESFCRSVKRIFLLKKNAEYLPVQIVLKKGDCGFWKTDDSVF